MYRANQNLPVFSVMSDGHTIIIEYLHVCIRADTLARTHRHAIFFSHHSRCFCGHCCAAETYTHTCNWFCYRRTNWQGYILYCYKFRFLLKRKFIYPTIFVIGDERVMFHPHVRSDEWPPCLISIGGYFDISRWNTSWNYRQSIHMLVSEIILHDVYGEIDYRLSSIINSGQLRWGRFRFNDEWWIFAGCRDWQCVMFMYNSPVFRVLADPIHLSNQMKVMYYWRHGNLWHNITCLIGEMQLSATIGSFVGSGFLW